MRTFCRKVFQRYHLIIDIKAFQKYYKSITQVFETGINDQGLMICTLSKLKCTKHKPKVSRKRQLKNFVGESFLQDLKHSLRNNGNVCQIENDFFKNADQFTPKKVTKNSWKRKKS